MRLNKKAGMQISINTIIILILAIAILGVGLNFIKNMLDPTFEQINQINEKLKDEMIAELRESNDRLTLRIEDKEMKKNEKSKLYFAIKNELQDVDGGTEFGINFGCISAASHDAVPEDDISFEFIDLTEELKEDEIEVGAVKIIINPSAKSTMYRCKSVVIEGGTSEDPPDLDTDEPYASKSFIITVK